MATTDTDVTQLVINKLTKQQYESITPSATELYAVTDEPAVDVMTGATSGSAGTSGTVPAPAAGDDTKFLQGDGTWGTPTDTTYTAGTNIQISAQNVISATDTTYSTFTGATTQVAGASGLVPAPTTSDPDKFLKGDGTWGTPAGKTYTAGDHISISNQDVISAVDYIHADAPTASTTPAGSITNGMIANSTLTASKFASGELLTLTMSTTDIGEGAPLAANTLYGVYE